MAVGGQLVGAGIAYVYNQFHLTLPFTSFHFYSHYLELTYLTFTILSISRYSLSTPVLLLLFEPTVVIQPVYKCHDE